MLTCEFCKTNFSNNKNLIEHQKVAKSCLEIRKKVENNDEIRDLDANDLIQNLKNVVQFLKKNAEQLDDPDIYMDENQLEAMRVSIIDVLSNEVKKYEK